MQAAEAPSRCSRSSSSAVIRRSPPAPCREGPAGRAFISTTSSAPRRIRRVTLGCGDEQVLPDERGEVERRAPGRRCATSPARASARAPRRQRDVRVVPDPRRGALGQEHPAVARCVPTTSPPAAVACGPARPDAATIAWTREAERDQPDEHRCEPPHGRSFATSATQDHAVEEPARLVRRRASSLERDVDRRSRRARRRSRLPAPPRITIA